LLLKAQQDANALSFTGNAAPARRESPASLREPVLEERNQHGEKIRLSSSSRLPIKHRANPQYVDINELNRLANHPERFWEAAD
jgi:hypothetical protein